MVGSHDLLNDGAQAEGVILESHVTHTITKTRVVIAVKFDDGETAEFSEDLVDHYEPPSHSLKGIVGNLTGENAIPVSFIPGSQLPNVPLHKYSYAFDYAFGRGVEARLSTYHLSENNLNNLPAYGYSDFDLSMPAGSVP